MCPKPWGFFIVNGYKFIGGGSLQSYHITVFGFFDVGYKGAFYVIFVGVFEAGHRMSVTTCALFALVVRLVFLWVVRWSLMWYMGVKGG